MKHGMMSDNFEWSEPPEDFIEDIKKMWQQNTDSFFNELYMGTFAASSAVPEPLTLETLRDCLDMMEREFPYEMMLARKRNLFFDYPLEFKCPDWRKE